MAKTAAAKKTTGRASVPAPRASKTTAVATKGDLDSMMNAAAGAGTSQDMSDNIVPLIYILQALSKPCVKGSPEYIKGAESGTIWPRGTKDLVDGEEGILVQPVHFDKCWIEWLPDRGGFVARHKERPREATQVSDPKKPEKKIWQMPNGNTVNESREHVVIVHELYDTPTPFVIPMSGSQHSASRGWMGLMNRKRTPDGKGIAPSYAYLYRMRTAHRTNGKDNWHGWDITDAGDDGAEMRIDEIDGGVEAFQEAQKVFQQFNAGVLRADNGGDETDTVTSTESADDDI